MIQLLINEFVKIRKAKIFYFSFILIALSPLFSLLILSLDGMHAVIGDYNGINIMFISLIASRTLFPIISMFLVKLEYDNLACESIFITPINRSKFVIAKSIISFIWLIAQVLFSILLVMLCKYYVLGQIDVLSVILKTLPNYFLLVVYCFQIQLFIMLITYIFRSNIISSIVLIIFTLLEYFASVFIDISYIPAIVSDDIILSFETGKVFFLVLLLGLTSLLILMRLISIKDFMK